jgi:hypothetical protein
MRFACTGVTNTMASVVYRKDRIKKVLIHIAISCCFSEGKQLLFKVNIDASLFRYRLGE